MIGYLRGEVMEHTDGKVLMLVSGVGYSVNVPSGPSYLSLLPGQAGELYIHTHVREDALDLFGFATRMEKEIFLTLLTVNGVGPKVAMGILTRVQPDDLIRAVVGGDVDSLTKIPGIGKKTAERVVLELGDKLRKKLEAGEFGGSKGKLAVSSTKGPSGASYAGKSGDGFSSAFHDAKEALVGLGYRENDVSVLLQRVLSEAETPPKHAEELVKTALRQLIS
jgi:Holliday junction DNA helicase RuvA